MALGKDGLYSLNFREGSFSETHIHTLACLCGSGAYASGLVQRVSEKSSSRKPRGHNEEAGAVLSPGLFHSTSLISSPQGFQWTAGQESRSLMPSLPRPTLPRWPPS